MNFPFFTVKRTSNVRILVLLKVVCLLLCFSARGGGSLTFIMFAELLNATITRREYFKVVCEVVLENKR